MNITENNKLIAEFMGFQVIEHDVFIPYQYANGHIQRLPKNGDCYEGDLTDLAFHNDWSCLMPVVENIYL